MIVSLFGIPIAIIGVYEPFFEALVTKVPVLGSLNYPAVGLFVFSILALAIGLERYATFEEAGDKAQRRHLEIIQALSEIHRAVEQQNQVLVKELSDIYETLTATITGEALIGHVTIYQEAIRLLKACKGSQIIRSTSLTATLIDNPAYYEALAKVVGQGKQKKLGMVYKVVMGCRLNEKGEPPPEWQQTIRHRRKFFRENNALDKLEIKCLDTTGFLDLLIIGDEHMIIAFPTIARDPYLRLGLRISNKDFVRSVAQWYEEYLWREAKGLNWSDEETQP